MTTTSTSGISDQSSPDSIKVGKWLFEHRTALPLPFVAVLLLVRLGEAPRSLTLMAAGVVLTVAGELLRIWAVHHIGAISRTRSGRLGPLVASGPFSLTRNPLYIGNIAIWVGFALTARLVWLAPLIAVLLLAEYHAIVQFEESLLLARYGDDYRRYQATVPRWFGASGAAASAVGSAKFSPGETLFSERGTLIAIALGYAALWLKSQV